MVLFSLVGLIGCSPILMILKVKQVTKFQKNSTISEYTISKTKMGNSGAGILFFSINAIVRSVLAFVPLIMFNIMTYVKFKKKLIFPSSKLDLIKINHFNEFWRKKNFIDKVNPNPTCYNPPLVNQVKTNSRQVICRMIVTTIWVFFTCFLGNCSFTIFLCFEYDNSDKGNNFELDFMFKAILNLGHALEFVHFYSFDKVFRNTFKEKILKINLII